MRWVFAYYWINNNQAWLLAINKLWGLLTYLTLQLGKWVRLYWCRVQGAIYISSFCSPWVMHLSLLYLGIWGLQCLTCVSTSTPSFPLLTLTLVCLWRLCCMPECVLWIVVIHHPMTGKMPCYNSVFVVSNVKDMTLKPVKYSILLCGFLILLYYKVVCQFSGTEHLLN